MNLSVRGETYYIHHHSLQEDKPYLLMLHGFMGSSKVFDHLIPTLTEFCNPVTMDLLGHGLSSGGENPERYHLEEQLADLFEIANRLKPSKFYLYGYSMGGRLALRFALEHPEYLSGLILESTTYGIEGTDKVYERIQQDEQRAERIEQDFVSFLHDWASLPIFVTGSQVPDDLQDKYFRIQAGQNSRQMARSLRGFGSARMESVRTRLHELDIPVLILSGEYDEKYKKLSEEMEHCISQGKAVVIPRAGHRVHLDHPLALSETLRSHITGQKCS